MYLRYMKNLMNTPHDYFTVIIFKHLMKIIQKFFKTNMNANSTFPGTLTFIFVSENDCCNLLENVTGRAVPHSEEACSHAPVLVLMQEGSSGSSTLPPAMTPAPQERPHILCPTGSHRPAARVLLDSPKRNLGPQTWRRDVPLLQRRLRLRWRMLEKFSDTGRSQSLPLPLVQKQMTHRLNHSPVLRANLDQIEQ